MRRWLRRRGVLDERAAEDRSNEAPELSPLEACMQMSLFGSTYVRLAKDGAAVPLAGDTGGERARSCGRQSTALDGAGAAERRARLGGSAAIVTSAGL